MDCVILLFLLLVLNCFEKLLSAVFGVGGGCGVALWILLPFSRFCEIFSKIGVNFCSFVVLFTVVVVVVLPVVVHFLVGLFFSLFTSRGCCCVDPQSRRFMVIVS